MLQLSLFTPSQIFEAQYKIQGLLPKVYIDFYNQCEVEVSLKFQGYTLGNSNYDLNQHAQWLLERNDVKNFLSEDDFVFQFKCDYGFWYFKLNGEEDPMVMCWITNCVDPFEISNLSYFLA